VNPALFAIAAIAFWSTNAVVAKLALGSLDVDQVQVLQFAGAAIVFAAAQISRASRISSSVPSILLGVIGLTGTMVFQYIAFAQGPIGEVNIIAYAWPLLAAITLLAKGAVPRPHVFLLLTTLGFLGAALVVIHPGAGLQLASVTWGHAAAIASAVCMATYTVAIGRIAIDQNLAHLGGAMVGIAIALIWCMLWGAGWPSPYEPAFWLGLYLGIGPIGVGYLLWATAMTRDQTGRVATLAYLTPVVSTGLLMTHGEDVHGLAILGAIIVVAACAAIGFESRSHASA
jgi:drug/metabolite transporter (DMT)-like permease